MCKGLSITVAIPTKDREIDLRRCLESLLQQTRLPDKLLVIDDGELSDSFRKWLRHTVNAKIPTEYIRKTRPSLVASRNLSIEKAETDILVFLDDDVVLEPTYLEELCKLYLQSRENIAGIAGVALNTPKKDLWKTVFHKVFALYAKGWKLLPWGFQTETAEVGEYDEADWIPGYNASFRVKILKKYRFREVKGGRTALDDIDLCWRLVQDGYKFIVSNRLRLYHYQSSIGRESAWKAGYKEGYARMQIFAYNVNKKDAKNVVLFFWALLGSALRHMLASTFYAKTFEHRKARFVQGIAVLKGAVDYAIMYLCTKRK